MSEDLNFSSHTRVSLTDYYIEPASLSGELLNLEDYMGSPLIKF